jgi:uncharacterized membrane protein
MSAYWKPLAFGAFVAIIAHLVVIGLIPNVIMNVALKRIAATAGGANKLFHAPLVTPQNQTIVRPSPDLAYSTCALDLSKGPVRVFIGKGSDYASAAFYSANTDNVFTLNDTRIGPQGARLLIVSARSPIQAQAGEEVISLAGDRGLMLVRRLAPSADAYARVATERANDTCTALNTP